MMSNFIYIDALQKELFGLLKKLLAGYAPAEELEKKIFILNYLISRSTWIRVTTKVLSYCQLSLK